MNLNWSRKELTHSDRTKWKPSRLNAAADSSLHLPTDSTDGSMIEALQGRMLRFHKGWNRRSLLLPPYRRYWYGHIYNIIRSYSWNLALFWESPQRVQQHITIAKLVHGINYHWVLIAWLVSVFDWVIVVLNRTTDQISQPLLGMRGSHNPQWWTYQHITFLTFCLIDLFLGIFKQYEYQITIPFTNSLQG